MGVGAIWLWRRPSSRGPRWYFTAVVLGYWFMTTPFGAGLLVNGLLGGVAVSAGVPAASVVEDSRSTSTRDQAKQIGPILRDHHIQRFVLVTSPMHMRRSLAVFRAAGFDPVASTAPLRSEQLLPPCSLMPDDEAWWLSDMAMYDYVA